MDARTGRVVLAALTAIMMVLPAGASWAAADVVVECEDFETYDSYDLGGMPIVSLFCTGASGYLAVNGLDTPGEWILVSASIPVAGCYESLLAYQAAYDDDVHFRVSLIGASLPGGEIAVDYSLTNGWGFG